MATKRMELEDGTLAKEPVTGLRMERRSQSTTHNDTKAEVKSGDAQYAAYSSSIELSSNRIPLVVCLPTCNVFVVITCRGVAFGLVGYLRKPLL